MEYDPQDQDIVTLITKLKEAGGKYPEDLLAVRRQSYLVQIAQIGLGIGAATGIENAANNGTTPNPPAVGGTLLETALVVAILAETSAVAYFYREKLSDFFQSITTEPRVQEVTALPIFTTALEIQGITPSPAVTATLPSSTVSASPSGTVVALTSTPIPGVVNESNPGASQIQSTPALNNSSNTDNDPNGNNGNHYGQTPKPDRTKEPGSNSDQSSNNSGNNDQTPKDKPTKTK